MKVLDLGNRVGEGLENFTLVLVSFVVPQIPMQATLGELADFLTISTQLLTMAYLFVKIFNHGNDNADGDKPD